MRHAFVPLLAVLLGLTVGLPPSSSTAVTDPAAGEAEYAAERLVPHPDTYPYPVPGRDTLPMTPTAELTGHGVFVVRPYPASVWSYRHGTTSPWVEAPLDRPMSVVASSGTGDFLVGASVHPRAGDLGLTVRTVDLGGTTVASSSQPAVPLIPGARWHVQVAAAGDVAYAAVSQGTDSGARSSLLFRSQDRGTTWDEPPTDLLDVAGLPATGALLTLDLQAEAEVVAAVVGGDRLVVSRDTATTFSAATPLPRTDGAQGPARVATDGATVRVAWLGETAATTPELHTALVAPDGSLTDRATVPTAPSTLDGGVRTAIMLAPLGSTYAVQVAGGRLSTLDPDGVWRRPIPAEPLQDERCTQGCQTMPVAAVYGDRLLYRGFVLTGRHFFVDRTPPRMVVVEGREVMPPGRTVSVRVEDDGYVASLSCRHTPGRAHATAPYCFAEGNRREGVHELTATVSDSAGNQAVLTHRWLVDGTPPRVRVTRRGPALVSDDPTSWSWDVSDAHGVRRVVAALVRDPLQRGKATRRVLPTARTSYSLGGPRPGESACMEVEGWDVAGNREHTRSCTSSMADDARLHGPRRTLHGRSYRHGTASLLVPGRAVRTDPDDRQGAVNWAFRVQRCPTCGSLMIRTSRGDTRVDLRSARTVFTTVYARDPARAAWTRLRGLVATGRVVVDGFWALDQ